MTVACDCDVLPLDDIVNLLGKLIVHIEQLLHAQSLLHIFIGINRRDTAACGAEFLICEALLLHDILHLVIRHADYCLFAYPEVFGSDFYSLFRKRIYLADKMLEVYDHTVAHDIDRSIAENTRGKQVEDEFALFVDNGVTGIVAALIAADYVIIGGEQVYHSALSFVTPVNSDY